jgi:TRAP-type C4-dicarboxylate transport system permease small subunit
MTRALDILHLVLKLLLGTLVGGLIIPVSMQVLSRYTGLIPRYIWTEEIARFCFIWMVMVGAMCAARDGTHFDLDLLPKSSSPVVEGAKRIFVHLMMLIVAGIFIWYGWGMIKFGWYQTSEIFSLPMNWIFAAWPLTGVVVALFLIEKIVTEVRLMRGETP